MRGQEENPERLRELILYIAHRMEHDDHVGRGRMKLAKLLFVIDFEAYARYGRPVTGTPYHAETHGPAPTGELLATRDLTDAGRFQWERVWDRQAIPVARDDSRLEVFERWQVELSDEQLERYQPVSAKSMIDEAHGFPGWIHAWRDGLGRGNPVPLESIFWNRARTEAKAWEREHARELSERLGR